MVVKGRQKREKRGICQISMSRSPLSNVSRRRVPVTPTTSTALQSEFSTSNNGTCKPTEGCRAHRFRNEYKNNVSMSGTNASRAAVLLDNMPSDPHPLDLT